MKKLQKTTIPPSLIAPCGMNCRLCRAFNRERNKCPGCRGDDSLKSQSCVSCKIKNCPELEGKRFCHLCRKFPCNLFDNLDKRYRTKYGLSVVENLQNIKKYGVRAFIRNEKIKWQCPQCTSLVCVHKTECIACNYAWKEQSLF